MDISILSSKEYTVTIENAAIHLLLAKRSDDKKATAISPPHSHAYMELFSCCNNDMTLAYMNSEGELDTIKLTAGCIAVIPANFTHNIVSTSPSAECYNICFIVNKHPVVGSLNLYEKLTKFCSGQQIKLIKNVQPACNTIKDICKTQSISDTYTPALQFATLLNTLVNSNKDAVAHEHTEKADAKVIPEIKRFAVLEQVIEHNFQTNISCAQVASLLHISERQLARIVKKHYGTTLHNILTRKRLQAAEKLLLNTDLPVDAVGEKSGFSNNTSFYRAFVRQFGITPQAYRNQNV